MIIKAEPRDVAVYVVSQWFGPRRGMSLLSVTVGPTLIGLLFPDSRDTARSATLKRLKQVLFFILLCLLGNVVRKPAWGCQILEALSGSLRCHGRVFSKPDVCTVYELVSSAVWHPIELIGLRWPNVLGCGVRCVGAFNNPIYGTPEGFD